MTLNRSCNLRCNWCYAKNTNFSSKLDLPLNNAFLIIDFCSQLGIKKIILIGGEPTLYKYLFEVISYAHLKGIKTNLVTNGIKLSNPSYLKKILDCGLSGVSLSLKGEDKETYEAISGYNMFSTALKAISQLTSQKLNFSVSMVITLDNIATISKGIKAAIDNGAKSISLSFCYDFNMTGKKNMSFIEHNNPIELIDAFYKYYADIDNASRGHFTLENGFPVCLWDINFFNMLKNKKQISGICQLLRGNGLLFDSEMNVIPCNSMYQITLGKFLYDFSNPEEYYAFLNKKNIRQIYEKLRGIPNKKCKNCNLLNYCGGGCTTLYTNYSLSELLSESKKHQEYEK